MFSNPDFRGRAIFYCPTCVRLLEQPIRSYFEDDNNGEDTEVIIVCPVCYNDAYFKFIVDDTKGEARCQYTWFHIFRDYREQRNHEIEFRKVRSGCYHNYDTGEIRSH